MFLVITTPNALDTTVAVTSPRIITEYPEKALRNIFKVLKAGGICYINSPNLNYFRKKIFFLADRKEHHINLFSHEDLSKLLKKTGFKIVKRWTYINLTYFFFVKFKSNIGIESGFLCTK